MKLYLKPLITCLLLCTGLAVFAQTEPPTQAVIPAAKQQAAEELLIAAGVKSQLSTVYDKMLDASITKVPEANRVKFKQIMSAFFGKYMSFEALKLDLVKIYSDAFTEAELHDITQFYLSPTGKKLTEKLPELFQKGMLLGQQKVQEHMGELQAELQKAFPQKATEKH